MTSSATSPAVGSPAPGSPPISSLGSPPVSMDQRVAQLYTEQAHAIGARANRFFMVLLALEWIACVVCALWLSPLTWTGLSSTTHPHVPLAIFIGGTVAALPIALCWRRPFDPLTRHSVAVAQMVFGSLLIHFTGGRIETHFHVFGSLAFLAFYRDWRVLLSATIVVGADHFLRGIFWPQSVYGVLAASPWRWLEHAAWVLFEDVCPDRDRPEPGRDARDRRAPRAARIDQRDHRGPGPRAHGRAGHGPRRGPLRQPGEERVPGQHEPRDPHADERRARHDRACCSTPTSPDEQRDYARTIRERRRAPARRSSTTSSTSPRSRPAS